MKTKRLLLILLLGLYSSFAFSGDFVEWKYEIIDLDNGKYEIKIIANIEEKWYIYGMRIEDGGPLPLYLGFENEESLNIIKEFSELTTPTKRFDNVFNMYVTSYENTANFSARLKNDDDLESVVIVIDGQACYTVDGRCVQVYKEITVHFK